MKMRREAAFRRAVMSSTFAFAGGLEPETPSASPGFGLGHTSSAARAHSSTNSNDFSRSSSSKASPVLWPTPHSMCSTESSRSCAQRRIRGGVSTISMPSCCRSSIMYKFDAIQPTGRCDDSTSRKRPAALPAGEVNERGSAILDRSSEGTKAVSEAICRTFEARSSLQQYACNSIRKGFEAEPSGSSAMRLGNRGMISEHMNSSPLQSFTSQYSYIGFTCCVGHARMVRPFRLSLLRLAACGSFGSMHAYFIPSLKATNLVSTSMVLNSASFLTASSLTPPLTHSMEK
mmetsp:Transcript_89387/g.252902  ORF Transcript_89387/g.252902 Transcript_89387/m.252902 type:complete len:289 (-) Transcript_89387:329-1195(-)